MQRPVWWVIGGALLLTGMGAAPQALTVGSQEARPGAQHIQLPLMLRGIKRTQVVALQAELRYDPARLHFQSTTIGPVAQAAGKQLSANSHEPGVLKLVLFGMNQRPLKDGVVASLIFNVAADQRPGPVDVQVSRVSAADPRGRPIKLEGVGGRVTIR